MVKVGWICRQKKKTGSKGGEKKRTQGRKAGREREKSDTLGSMLSVWGVVKFNLRDEGAFPFKHGQNWVNLRLRRDAQTHDAAAEN